MERYPLPERPKAITISWLVNVGATDQYLARFARTFGCHMELTRRTLERAGLAGLSLSWLADLLLSKEKLATFESARDVAVREFGKARDAVVNATAKSREGVFSSFVAEDNRSMDGIWQSFEVAKAGALADCLGLPLDGDPVEVEEGMAHA